MARNSDDVQWLHDFDVAAGTMKHSLAYETHIDFTDAEAAAVKAAALLGQGDLDGYMANLGAPRSTWYASRTTAWKTGWRAILVST